MKANVLIYKGLPLGTRPPVLASFWLPKRAREPQCPDARPRKNSAGQGQGQRLSEVGVWGAARCHPPPCLSPVTEQPLRAGHLGEDEAGRQLGHCGHWERGWGCGGRLPSRGFLQLGLGALSSLLHPTAEAAPQSSHGIQIPRPPAPGGLGTSLPQQALSWPRLRPWEPSGFIFPLEIWLDAQASPGRPMRSSRAP